MFATGALAQWHTQSSGTAEAFYGATFVDSTTAYLSGWGDDGASIFKSTDRGSNWSPVWHNDGSYFIFGVDFTDPEHGAVAGYDPDCNCALLLQSPDSGTTWLTRTFANSFGFYKILSPSPSTLIACGYNGAIIRSTNGGKFWDAGVTGNDTLIYRLMHFADAETGYAVGGAAFNFLDKIYKTTDGGATWALQRDFDGARSLGDIFFLDPMTGFYVGSDGTDCIYRTTNGGSSWSRVYAGTDKSVFIGIVFADTLNGYAANVAGRIVQTTDGGLHWGTAYSDPSMMLNAIAVSPTGAIIAGTSDGTVVTGSRTSSVSLVQPMTTFARIEDGKMLHLYGDAAAAREIEIHDMLGRSVLKRPTLGNDEFSLASLSHGVYFWTASDGTAVTGHGKVMIE